MKKYICECHEEGDELGGFGEMFSKGHYIEVANLIAGLKEPIFKEDIINRFIWMFSADNPKFDASRFKEYILKRSPK